LSAEIKSAQGLLEIASSKRAIGYLIFPSPNPQRTTKAFDCELHGSLKQSLTHSAARFPLASTPNTVRCGSFLGVLLIQTFVARPITRTKNLKRHPLESDSTDGAGCGRPHGWGRFFSLGTLNSTLTEPCLLNVA
jgi:hypothetical protein